MDLGLEGKLCLVTGASAGSGWAVARALAEEGARVAITARRADRLAKLASEIASATGRAPLPVAGDISRREVVAKVVSAVQEREGGIDVLVNCAGASRPLTPKDGDEVWLQSMELNFHATRRFAEAVLPAMKEKGWGRIVNFSGSTEPRAQNAALPAKAAIHSWAKGLSCEAAPFGITVNCIAPGRIATEQIMERLYPTEDARATFIQSNIPAGRFGTPEEIAAVTLFLCSKQASYVTGAVVPVDGGMHYFAH